MNNLIDVTFDTSEAFSVLSILEKHTYGSFITDDDWNILFSCNGYKLLKQREKSIDRPFEDVDFIRFVLSSDLHAKRESLCNTLLAWREVNLVNTGEKALAYLPPCIPIRAKIYPVIKPKTNSFIFDLENNPSIFLYLDPQVNPKQLENTLIHELHHIGLGKAQIEVRNSEEWSSLPINTKLMLMWVNLFGEGMAMLAAAGGTEIHPHLYSNIDDRERWDRDLLKFESDFREVEKFLLDVLSGNLSGQAMMEVGNSFFGIQGPWYTVGWKMATTIECKMGRPALIEAFCDPRKLLSLYNLSANDFGPNWDKELLINIK